MAKKRSRDERRNNRNNDRGRERSNDRDRDRGEKKQGRSFEVRDRSGKLHRIGSGGGGHAGPGTGEAPRPAGGFTERPSRSERPRHGAQTFARAEEGREGRKPSKFGKPKREERGGHGKRFGKPGREERQEREGKKFEARGRDERFEHKERGGKFKRREEKYRKPRKGEEREQKRFGRPQGKGTIKAKAIVDKNMKGFAFLAFADRRREDAFVPPREAEMLFHGDRVEVTLNSRGEVLEILVLEHRFREIVGRYEPHPSGRGGWVVYERKRAREEVYMPTGGGKSRPGDWIKAKLEFHEEGPYGVTGEVSDVYGPMLPASADIGMVAAEYNLIEEHSQEAVREAENYGKELTEDMWRGRRDLRGVPFITIDGETARDFDDAVFVEKRKSGFTLWVAIADVSHYVKDGTALDREARSRGTSVYFPERAFHMLPRALSENLCSLKPNVPRLAMVAKMEFDHNAKITNTEVMDAVIQSKRRATYNEIQKEWEENQKDKDWEYMPHFQLYQALRRARLARGSIDFDLPEAEIRVDDQGEVLYIKERERWDSHKLIEEFMIAANEAVTEWMMDRSWPFVYRIHDEPSIDALHRFEELARTAGVRFSVDQAAASPKVLADLVRSLDGNPAQPLLNSALLRSMKQAIYSSTHGIHYGLASEGYTHFTSPIRRYPDLVVHRLMRWAIQVEAGKEQMPRGKKRDEVELELAEICEHCSYRERLAAEADREAIKLKQVRLMIRHLGEEFDGKIVGMVESGFFVKLSDPYVEGLVLSESMGDDLYQFNEQKMVFVGRRKKRMFRIGDKVRIRVLKAEIDRRLIEFGLAESS